jgi:hypothetical protein
MRPKSRHILDVPSENGAEAVLQMLYSWPQLRHFTSIRTLHALYNFDYETLECAARSLERRKLLETRSCVVGKGLCRQTVTLYRRTSTP